MKRYLLTFIMITAICTLLFSGCSNNTANENTIKESSAMETENTSKTDDTADFIKGVDISSVISLEKSGVKYYDETGKEQDIFKTLSESGINHIRVRIWNDPYDNAGNGYGGGNCDVNTAVEIGKRAAKYGMKLCVDFHYSDFWADPKKQFVPKEWTNYTIDQKSEAVYTFTKSSLKTITDAGSTIGIVQIGNEINSGICGETATSNIMQILSAASKGVRDFATENSSDTKVAVHYTDVNDKSRILYYADTLKDNDIDYDIFGVSYYPYWHGTLDNLTNVLKEINSLYQKDTLVLETSYAYTLEDGDGFGNTVGSSDLVPAYEASIEGQTDFLKDIMKAVYEAEGLGIFYWEPAWIPVGTDKSDNSSLWEKYGSGWASSYSSEYDPDDAGKYYGGSSWDNQALFNFQGKPLASLDVFNQTGITTS